MLWQIKPSPLQKKKAPWFFASAYRCKEKSILPIDYHCVLPVGRKTNKAPLLFAIFLKNVTGSPRLLTRAPIVFFMAFVPKKRQRQLHFHPNG